LPQDKIYKSGPKSTKEEYLKFKQKVDQAKNKIKNPLF